MEILTLSGRTAGRQQLHPDESPLEMYKRAVEMRTHAVSLLPRDRHPLLYDQLERASLLIVLSLGESAKRSNTTDKRRFFQLARANVTKAIAAVDVMRVRGIAGPYDTGRVRYHLVVLAQCLNRVLARSEMSDLEYAHRAVPFSR